AVGWYGDGGEHRLTEADQPVTADFASQLCNAWEERASEAAVLGIRVVLIR
ncbi:MAG: epimerase, partial [Pseudomonas stutzeri]|nr:epimerase [Stutzerimonas stutzeri]